MNINFDLSLDGPWYSWREALVKLDILDAELRYLVEAGWVTAVVYTKPRSFLIFSDLAEGWAGHAICQYRGHLSLPVQTVITLMYGDDIFMGKNSVKLLEKAGITDWISAYPYSQALPLPPITAWQPQTLKYLSLNDFSATLTPTIRKSFLADASEIVDTILGDHKDRPLVADTITKHFGEGINKEKLYFNGDKFVSNDLRIPASEINKYHKNSQALTEFFQDIQSLFKKSRPAKIEMPQPKVTPTKTRENQLHELIKRILLEQPNIGAKEAWALIEKDCNADKPRFDTEHILLKVDSICIEWRSRYGNEQPLIWSSFQTRLSKIKNK